METSRYENSLKRLLTSESTPRLGLARMKSLLHALGNPERTLNIFHVAGTNGKGSTCAFLASILEKQLGNVGLYTSPHLCTARERIQFNRNLIEEDLFSAAEEAVFSAAKKIGEYPTFFERMTAMAFWSFSQKKVEAAVIEVGLGGRLDATNAVQPLATAITRIDIDHTHILGDTLQAIAFEKAGIIKAGVPIITGWQSPEALNVIASIATEKNAALKIVSAPYEMELALKGPHQKRNAAIAVETVRAVASISDCEVADALSSVTWPGRFELIRTSPPVLLDGAHNASGMAALAASLGEKPWSGLEITFIVGGTSGHSQQEMADALMPIARQMTQIFVTQSRSERAIAADELASYYRHMAPCEVFTDLAKALGRAEKIATKNKLTLVCGSLFLVGEARSFYRLCPRDPEFPLY